LVTTPEVVIRPIVLLPALVNHSAPSGPAVIPSGPLMRLLVKEAPPWHAGIRRIARVVLLSVSAGMALTDGDTGAAVELGRQADLEATELGVERELPLIRAVLARSLLQRDDVPGAAECALGALDAAENMQSQFPLAICFETAALIAATAVATRSSRADELSLLATADVIRSQGDRLALPPLSSAVLQLSQDHGAAAAMDIRAAALLARRLLSPLAVRLTSPVLRAKPRRRRPLLGTSEVAWAVGRGLADRSLDSVPGYGG